MNTPSQQRAIDSTASSICLLAGAGSGKTRTLTERIARLIRDGASPEEFLVLTFTRKAARELKERLAKLIDPAKVRKIWAGTFHGISYRILSQWGERIGYATTSGNKISVVSPEESEYIFSQVVKEYGWKGRKRDLEDAMKKLAHGGENPEDPNVDRIIKEYWSRLRECNALDFDQLLLEVHRLFRESPEALTFFKNKFRYVFVDEYQDTDQVQYNLHEIIGAENLFVVGDLRQSIYSFRGADNRIISNFESDHFGAEIIDLLECFRCGEPIVKAANTLIANNPEGEKPLVSTIPDGEISVRRNTVEEIANIIDVDMAFDPRESIAIIARTHAALKNAEAALIEKGIPCHRVGAITDELKDSTTWKTFHSVLRMALNKKDSLAFMGYGAAWLNPAVGDDTMASIRQAAGASGISMVEEYLRRFPESNLAKLIEFMPETITETVGMILGGMKEHGKELEISEEQKALVDYIGENASEAMTPAGWLEWSSTKDMHSELEKTQEGKVTLLTAHAAKGLEWDTVFIADFSEGVFPSKMAIREKNLSEERRLAYVAVTRARKQLFIMSKEKPSRFIVEAGL